MIRILPDVAELHNSDVAREPDPHRKDVDTAMETAAWPKGTRQIRDGECEAVASQPSSTVSMLNCFR